MNDNNSEIQLPDYVLVNPRLTDDPVYRQGEIGVITAAILNRDEFFVGFDDGQVGLYSADALLMLKQPESIYEYMHENALKLSVDDFKNLKNIALLLDYGTPREQRTAMEIARKNLGVQPAALVSLEERLGLKQSYKRGR
ncbi:hypothetical protein [Mucilaginibacter gotjawali]|uniref:Uncharacterized protein n=2 Tax=Mucilaginibacter gotjawali TaxID=1550579 RepID=A0A125T1W8_9SPHI|nr:hypothetical protein [Mucilaginibacter gotjawali]MBB3057996.1 hypothetical protein [Mucilaginibacter gotjawali]BAU51972.1 hypothetical protein MgSA37_00121 [Mucilaginibacter gotjawali]